MWVGLQLDKKKKKTNLPYNVYKVTYEFSTFKSFLSINIFYYAIVLNTVSNVIDHKFLYKFKYLRVKKMKSYFTIKN